ncbi:MAG: UDP-N-acetylmuramoyl-L-alanine--D-glutamate ligase [Clostridiales bacterium]|nr:UDP-N-acetylmuramoyl-L-alanine--D-glutamate ligase [Clostridiales bacterium]
MLKEGMDILVVGLGTSGEACARYLLDTGSAGCSVRVTVVDGSETEALQATAADIRSLGATVLLGVSDIAAEYDLALMSPGIPPASPLFRAAHRASVETISEIEFAYRRSSAPWIAVTGTNGKTTVTSLIGQLLLGGGVAVRVAGNIGMPAISAVAETGPAGAIVAEVSSFQLALTSQFHPRVAVLLNITPDHLDWHGDMATYTADKARVFANLTQDDTAVVDVDDPGAAPFADVIESRGARVVRTSVKSVPEGGVGVGAGGYITAMVRGVAHRVVHRDALRIRGAHNLANACAATAAALAFGVSVEDVRNGLESFEPLAHRLEPVGIVEGVEYFNDSKATNPGAAIKALESFSDRRTTVLLGGRNKGASFDELAWAVGGRRARAVVFGEAADEIAAALVKAGVDYEAATDLRSAVGIAHRMASEGDVVVLSPACASFDEFASYADRGSRFKEMIASLGREVG